jgi:hypothetical protein
MKRHLLAFLTSVLPVVSFGATFDVIAHVTQIEPGYVPDHLVFAIDQNAGACAAGPWLFYSANPAANNPSENVKAMYAGMTAALQAGTLVEVYGNDTGCLVTNVHFLSHP